MKTTGPDDFVDVPLDEIERFSLVQKNRITAADNSGKASLSHKKEMIKLKLLCSHPNFPSYTLGTASICRSSPHPSEHRKPLNYLTEFRVRHLEIGTQTSTAFT